MPTCSPISHTPPGEFHNDNAMHATNAKVDMYDVTVPPYRYNDEHAVEFTDANANMFTDVVPTTSLHSTTSMSHHKCQR